MSKQDLVEWMIVIAMFLLPILFISWVLGRDNSEYTAEYQFRVRDHFVQECDASERYTHEDCIVMSSGWKP